MLARHIRKDKMTYRDMEEIRSGSYMALNDAGGNPNGDVLLFCYSLEEATHVYSQHAGMFIPLTDTRREFVLRELQYREAMLTKMLEENGAERLPWESFAESCIDPTCLLPGPAIMQPTTVLFSKAAGVPGAFPLPPKPLPTIPSGPVSPGTFPCEPPPDPAVSPAVSPEHPSAPGATPDAATETAPESPSEASRRPAHEILADLLRGSVRLVLFGSLCTILLVLNLAAEGLGFILRSIEEFLSRHMRDSDL